ncbi:MAG: phosphate ABC transporter permease PstA [Microthrixaceae bacterium]
MAIELDPHRDATPLAPIDLPPPAAAEPAAAAEAPFVAAEPPAVEDVPFRPKQLSSKDRVEYLLSLGSGLAFAWVLCLVMDWRAPLTFAIWALVWFLGCSYALSRDRTSKVVAQDRFVTTLIWLSGMLAVGVLVWMLVFVFLKGIGGLSLSFFTEDMAEVGPLDPGGGIKAALIGTLEQIAIATVISVPIAILTAVYLHEIKGRFATPVRFIVDAMSGLPSIVAGLVVFTIWVNEGHGFSGASAGVALAIMMIPIVTRTAEEILRTIDDGLRESALALGAPQWRAVLQVVLPTARSGLITASILGVARAIGETAPVLLTAFGSSVTNLNPFSGPQANLPLYIWGLLREPNEVSINRAWSAALVLIMLVLVLFTLARVIGERGAKKRGAR